MLKMTAKRRTRMETRRRRICQAPRRSGKSMSFILPRQHDPSHLDRVVCGNLCIAWFIPSSSVAGAIGVFPPHPGPNDEAPGGGCPGRSGHLPVRPAVSRRGIQHQTQVFSLCLLQRTGQSPGKRPRISAQEKFRRPNGVSSSTWCRSTRPERPKTWSPEANQTSSTPG